MIHKEWLNEFSFNFNIVYHSLLSLKIKNIVVERSFIENLHQSSLFHTSSHFLLSRSIVYAFKLPFYLFAKGIIGKIFTFKGLQVFSPVLKISLLFIAINVLWYLSPKVLMNFFRVISLPSQIATREYLKQ